MKEKDKLRNFKKMWTWLMAYPAHDREYYMKHVARLDEEWINSCPLANNLYVEDCNGCELLWERTQGTLCTDPRSPLHNWLNTERNQPDKRRFYASQLAVMAVNFSRQQERRIERRILRRKS